MLAAVVLVAAAFPSVSAASFEPPAKANAAPACPPDDTDKWESVDGFHAFRIWYPQKADKDEAEYLRKQMDGKIWPKETDLMNTQPNSKPLEICLVGGLPGQALGNTPGQHGCDETDANILMLDSLGDKDSRDVLAHEFFHALQYSLNVRCEDTFWWRESSAEWAEDFVYPADNREHDFAKRYFSDIGSPLPDKCDCNKPREYGSYVFPFFLARSQHNQLISKIWHQAQQEPLLQAMDDELPGGFKKQWPKFTVDAWNDDPVEQFDKWDGLDDGVSQHNDENDLTLGPGHADQPQVNDIPHLAARYFSYEFTDDTRTVTFVNSTPFADGSNPDAQVWAIIGIKGQKPRVENWTGKKGMAFCLGQPDEKLEDLTLVFSNSSPTDDMTPDPRVAHPTPIVAPTSAGCTQWSGTVTASWSPIGGVTDHATETFTLKPTFPSDFKDGFDFIAASYVTTGGTLTWSESGADPDSGCSYSGSDTVPIPSGVSPLVMLWRLDAPITDFDAYEWLNASISPWDPMGTEHSSCPDGNGGTVTDVTPIDLSDATLPLDSTNGYAAGHANGLTITGSSQGDTSFGPTSWTWNLTSPG